MRDERPFDCVRMMREIREQISREMDGMTFEEQRRWIQEQLATSDTLRGYNAVNVSEGHPPLVVKSPQEVFRDGG